MKTQIDLLDGAHLTAVQRLNILVEHFDYFTHYQHDQCSPAEIMRILIARGMHDTARRLAECLDEVQPVKASDPEPYICLECHRQMESGSSYLLCVDCAAKSTHNRD